MFFKEAKLAQKYPRLCLGSELWPLLEKLYLNFANIATVVKVHFVAYVYAAVDLGWKSG